VLTSALKPILVVTMPTVADRFESVIAEMRYGINFKLGNFLGMENAHLTHEDWTTSTDKPENRWTIHRVSSDILTSTSAKCILVTGSLQECLRGGGV